MEKQGLLSRLAGSSTLIVSIFLPTLWAFAKYLGVEIPWPVLCIGISGYALKEAASKFGQGTPGQRE